MKLISLNIWGGILYDELMAFVERESATTDIFCFQESFDEPTHPAAVKLGAQRGMTRKLQGALAGFNGYFPQISGPVRFMPGNEMVYHAAGIATFVRRPIAVSAHGTVSDLGGNGRSDVPGESPLPHMYITKMNAGGRSFAVANFHGIVDSESGKRDSDLMTRQSRAVLDATRRFTEPSILVGDFNLRPETESIAMFARAGYRNLIAEYGVGLTRSSHYRDMETYKDYVSDYAFVSPGIRVTDFRVMPDEVSDHLPLVVEFSL